ncbi:MAG: exosortase C-terminal domain/associated protein EpsI [Gemmatimonadota bacterium]
MRLAPPRGSWYAAAAPALVLLLGVVGRWAVSPERALSLKAPLAEFPDRVGDYRVTGEEQLSSGVSRVLHADEYLLRTYRETDGRDLTLFVAFYGRQHSGSTIHSPRNCLPGSGWEPVSHRRVGLPAAGGEAEVNRYIVEHKSGARALVFYWYQGRGRVAASEYRVKWNLLRDAILRRRSDEALVRLVFPLKPGEDPESSPALRTAGQVARLLQAYLPS